MRHRVLIAAVLGFVIGSASFVTSASAHGNTEYPDGRLSVSSNGAVARASASLPQCKSSWLAVSIWNWRPVGTSGQSTLDEVVRVSSSGHECSISGGWVRFGARRSSGQPYVTVRQADVGRASRIELSAGMFAVERATFRFPWRIVASTGVCVSAVPISIAPPGSSTKTARFELESGCGDDYVGVVHVLVRPLAAVRSGVPNATGTLVADLEPGPMAVGTNGELYIDEPTNNQVVARLPKGEFRVIAGTGRQGFSGDGGPATKATLNHPQGLALGPDGSLYIADTGNNRIRKVSRDGVISTVAGDGHQFPPLTWSPSGPALRTFLWTPWAVAVARNGVIDIAESNGDVIDALHNGTLTSLIGPKNLAVFYRRYHTTSCDPSAVVADRNGDIYFSCGSVILMRTPEGRVEVRTQYWLALGPGSDDRIPVVEYAAVLRRLNRYELISSTAAQGGALPRFLAPLGPFSPQNVALGSNGSLYLDQSDDLNQPPAIVVRERSGELRLLWGADA